MAVKDYIKEHWYNHPESARWYALIQKYAKGRSRGLDIGTSSGFSACAMALEGVSVISLDPNLKTISIEVSKELKVYNKLIFLAITSDDFFETNDVKFDIIVVDGCHDYDFVTRDLDNSWRYLEKGGVIIADDYERYNGTRRAIDDWIKKYGVPSKVDEGKMIIWKE